VMCSLGGCASGKILRAGFHGARLSVYVSALRRNLSGHECRRLLTRKCEACAGTDCNKRKLVNITENCYNEIRCGTLKRYGLTCDDKAPFSHKLYFILGGFYDANYRPA
jgi:hypothetical protein